jgi:hypothetical protein
VSAGRRYGAWPRAVLTLAWIVLKLTLVAALLNRNAADFIYAGF